MDKKTKTAGPEDNRDPDHFNYLSCMEEIKRRIIAIDHILDKTATTSYPYTNVEFVALQFRKIFELIILATLASHSHLFEGLAQKLRKEWQIGKVVRIIRKRNPRFYPSPIDRVPSSLPNIKDEWVDVGEGFLTLEQLIEAHSLIGNLMHAANPYSERVLIETIEQNFPIWRARIVRLLNNHIVRFPDDETVMYVGMQNESGRAHSNTFSKLRK